MCEIKTTIKFSFSKESDKPNIGEAVNFVKSLDADHGQVDAIYRMAEESAIYVKWKSEESMLHILTFNSDDLIFHYANGKKPVLAWAMLRIISCMFEYMVCHLKLLTAR